MARTRKPFKGPKERIGPIIKLFQRYIPDPKCALNHENPLQLLVATILSAQCTDERVNLVTPRLFARFKTADDFAAADQSEIEEIIRSTGFYKNKAKSIKSMAMSLVEKHGGQVPQTLGELVELAGVGRKTANVVMGNAFSVASGVVVDTHVTRLSYRLGLTNHKTPEKIEKDLMKLVPQKHWVNFSHWLILHGRQTCKARKPRCNVCFLESLCPKRF